MVDGLSAVVDGTEGRGTLTVLVAVAVDVVAKCIPVQQPVLYLTQ